MKAPSSYLPTASATATEGASATDAAARTGNCTGTLQRTSLLPEASARAPLFIVMNRSSGAHVPGHLRQMIEHTLAGTDRSWHILEASQGSELPALADEACRRAHIENGIAVAAGGDGTLSLVGGRALDSGCHFAAIPAGTFNCFGRAQGISEDPPTALRGLLDGVLRPTQVGLINGRAFLVNASIGLYSTMLEERESRKRRFGRHRAVALLSALATLTHRPTVLALRLDIDGRRMKLHTPSLFIANNALQLQQVGLDGIDALTHGHLVAGAPTARSPWGLFKLFVRGAFGKLAKSRDLHQIPFRLLTVRSSRFNPWHTFKVAADGEVFMERTPIRFEVAPQPLLLIAPRDAVPAHANDVVTDSAMAQPSTMPQPASAAAEGQGAQAS